MPRTGITAYDLLISCPSDVAKFVDIIRECVDGFNRTIGMVNNVEIVPKHWSTDSYPQSGDKPQELLNKQFVRDCDAAVAIFWTKFGTPTDKYNSGTEEEIEEMLASGKQVFMYFFDAPINPSVINMDQYAKVNEFREKYKDKGIYVVIKNENELRQQFTNHLALHFLPLVTGEKISSSKRLFPILKIKDESLTSDTESVVKHSNFSKSKFISEKKESLFNKFSALQKEFLPSRDKKEIEGVQPALSSNMKEIQKLVASTQMFYGIASDAEIPEQWIDAITAFASRNEIQIEREFWNVGNLKKRTSPAISPLVGGGISLKGTEQEKGRYESLESLYWGIKEYEEYVIFFAAIDQYGVVNLVLTNIGNTYDEDIDVKLIVKKDCLLKTIDVAVPGINIIDEIVKMKLTEYAFEIQNSDEIDRYSDYPIQPHNYNYSIPNAFGRKSVLQEYENSKSEYKANLERIFCYEYFSKDDCDVYIFHISYIKHNTAIAFPSSLVLKDIPDSIEYEISSKFVESVIKGKIDIKR